MPKSRPWALFWPPKNFLATPPKKFYTSLPYERGWFITVIAWDGKTLAADKRGCSGQLFFTVTKIKRVNKCLLGSSGDFSPIQAVFDWYEKGADPEKLPECQKDKDRWCSLLVITPEGKIFRYEQDGFPYEIEEDKFAIGSGRDFAFGAMAMGADAAEAVKVACRFDPGCGNGVDRPRLK